MLTEPMQVSSDSDLNPVETLNASVENASTHFDEEALLQVGIKLRSCGGAFLNVVHHVANVAGLKKPVKPSVEPFHYNPFFKLLYMMDDVYHDMKLCTDTRGHFSSEEPFLSLKHKNKGTENLLIFRSYLDILYDCLIRFYDLWPKSRSNAASVWITHRSFVKYIIDRRDCDPTVKEELDHIFDDYEDVDFCSVRGFTLYAWSANLRLRSGEIIPVCKIGVTGKGSELGAIDYLVDGDLKKYVADVAVVLEVPKPPSRVTEVSLCYGERLTNVCVLGVLGESTRERMELYENLVGQIIGGRIKAKFLQECCNSEADIRNAATTEFFHFTGGTRDKLDKIFGFESVTWKFSKEFVHHIASC